MRQFSLVRRGLVALGAMALAAVGAIGLAASGTAPAAAAAPPEVFAGFDGAAFLSGTTPYIATLNVPAGSYVASAKVTAFSGLSTSAPKNQVRCELRAGVDFDRSTMRLGGGDVATISNSVVHTFSGAGQIRLECNDVASDNASALLEHLKIVAVRVNSPISNIKLG